jgi:hypothetical protein
MIFSNIFLHYNLRKSIEPMIYFIFKASDRQEFRILTRQPHIAGSKLTDISYQNEETGWLF